MLTTDFIVIQKSFGVVVWTLISDWPCRGFLQCDSSQVQRWKREEPWAPDTDGEGLQGEGANSGPVDTIALQADRPKQPRESEIWNTLKYKMIKMIQNVWKSKWLRL